MAAIDDLISQIDNPDLRARIQSEVNRINKQKKFGLVFEEHLPECTPLHGVPIQKGSLVALKQGKINELFRVVRIHDNVADCAKKNSQDICEIALVDLVAVAEFGEPIYPYLKTIGNICNAPNSDLWHALIEADNYHALQLLEYLYAGRVDCIYIDPPYNTGARDWKYNNDYVDSADSYRHSKWLSMMEKRLKIAKRLLNPYDSVLIVTIDEKEYLHLGCLLEEMFPESKMQMVSSVINPAGVSRQGAFARVDEYVYVLRFGNAEAKRLALSDEWRLRPEDKRAIRLRWNTLMRTGSNVLRSDRKNLFYPIFVYEDGHAIHSVGEPYYGNDRSEVVPPAGTVAIWPIRSNNDEGNWQISNTAIVPLIKKGYVHLGRFTETGMAISYLKKGEIQKIESGTFKVDGYGSDGSVISGTEATALIPGTQWRIASHDATLNGTKLLQEILGEKRFSYPKSLYAVADVLRFFISNKPNALIVDFFAGSGTTLHAVNLLNAEDSGNRRCIMVTNNEVSEAEAKTLTAQGFNPGDDAWEAQGIARYVTWPRTVCSIEGTNVNGEPLKGTYLNQGQPMSNGFRANAVYFKLGFLNKTSVSLGRQFKEMLPTLWMKAGASGPCPKVGSDLPPMLVLPQNKFAVLLDEAYFSDFEEEVRAKETICTLFIVTDSDFGYREMISHFERKSTFQLYRDYLDNFRINAGR